MRSVLKYPGSKWNIVNQIVSMLPKHHSYLEPFFGSGAVLFSKSPSDIETINDLDNDVVNLFRCIQKDSERLARMVMTTPFSREVYEDTYKIGIQEQDEPHRKALRFLIRCWQGYGYRTNGYKSGWKNDVKGREKAYSLWNWYRLPDWIIDIAERLKMVQIENMPAIELIKRFNYKNVLMYLDPPYVLGTRAGKQYRHEMTDTDHEELLKIILQSEAKIIISGYESEMYNDYLKDWGKRTFQSNAEHGLKREEVVWFNFETDKQMNLFSFIKECEK